MFLSPEKRPKRKRSFEDISAALVTVLSDALKQAMKRRRASCYLTPSSPAPSSHNMSLTESSAECIPGSLRDRILKRNKKFEHILKEIPRNRRIYKAASIPDNKRRSLSAPQIPPKRKMQDFVLSPFHFDAYSLRSKRREH